jgi:hypothetical protein
MNATRKRAAIAATALISAMTLFTALPNFASAKDASALTLEHLKNGSYQIPTSACGFTVVNLHDGKGTAQDMQVIFGRAVFGKLTDKHEPGAVVHLAYKDPMFGWMQQVVFVVERNGKILQIAELGLDEREQLKNIECREGNALIETTLAEDSSGKVYKKCVKAELVDTKEGCELTATKYNWYTTEGNQEPAPKLVSLRVPR